MRIILNLYKFPIIRTLSGICQPEVSLPFEKCIDAFRRQFLINSFLLTIFRSKLLVFLDVENFL